MRYFPSRSLDRVFTNESIYSGLAVLTLVAAPTQTGNIQEWKNAALTTLAYVNPTGGFFGAQVIATGNISGANFITAGLVDGVDVSAFSGIFATHTGASTAHNTTSAIVGISDTQTLTNKTITGLTNQVAATHLHAQSGLVSISGSSLPSAGYVLIASSSTNAAWNIPYSFTGWTRITDGTNNATGSTTGDTFKLRSANNILTVAVGDNDVTHGDNALFTIVQSNINHQLISGAGSVTHTQIDTHVTSTTGHGTASAIVGISDTQTLTNKTITGLTNVIAATHLHAQAGLISISGATAPSTGQVLTAISSTSASWQNLPTASLFTGWSIVTDGTNRLTGSLTGDTIKFRSASTMLTVGVSDNDPTHGDNVLYTVNPANIPHTGLSGVGTQTHAQIDTHITSTTGHGTSSAVVGINDTQTLTNKTVTGLSNTVSATHLQIQSGLVSISGAALPTSGQVLTAISSTVATWQTISATGGSSSSFTGWGRIIDTSNNQITGSVTGDWLKFRSANTMLTVGVTDADVTHGDNVLYTINPSNIPHTGLSGVGTQTHAQIDTHITSTTGHGTSSAIVGISDTQSLTNKTITGLSNQVWASHLLAGPTGISISGSAPPTSGQVLTAISASGATWQTSSAGTPFTGWSRIIDTSGNQITGSTTGDWLKLRSAGTPLTVTVKNADPTHGDNVLFTLNQSEISHGNLANLAADDHAGYVRGDASRTSSHISLMPDVGENFVPVTLTQGFDQFANMVEIYNNGSSLNLYINYDGTLYSAANMLQNGGFSVLDTNNTATLYNKTITGLSNSIAATRLHAGATMVSISGAGAPSSGQVLTAISSSGAIWQSVSISGATFNGWSLITDGTNNITGSATGDTLKFRSATGAITIVATNADPTHGDNVLYNLVPSAISHTTLADIGTKSHATLESDILFISSYILAHEASTSTHGVVGNIVGTASSQTLTNKIITGLSNVVAATHLHAQAGLVMVSGSAAPTSGQVLTAISSTEATWQSGSSGPGGGISFATAYMISQLCL